MKPTKQMIRCAEVVFAALAYTDTIKPIVEKIQLEALLRRKAMPDTVFIERGLKMDLITDIRHTYMMSKRDHKIWWSQVLESYKNENMYVDQVKCPLLIAEHNERVAKWELLKAAEEITGLSFDSLMLDLKKFKEAVELSLRLCAPYINKENPFKPVKNNSSDIQS